MPLRKNTTVSQAIIVFYAMFSMVICGVVYFIFLVFFDSHIKANQKRLIDSWYESKADRIAMQIENYEHIIRDTARFQIITKTIMNGKEHQSAAIDFMNDLLILGKKHPLELLDFERNTIGRTHTFSDLLMPTQVTSLINEPNLNITFLGNASSANRFIRLEVPIYYHQHIEGYLAIYLDFSTLSDVRHEGCQKLTCYVSFTHGDLRLQTQGSSNQSHSPRSIEIPQLGINLNYGQDYILLDKKSQVMGQIITTFLIIWLICYLVIKRLGTYFFVDPLVRMNAYTSKVSESKPLDEEQIKSPIFEISNLYRNFRAMAKKVHQREQSLIEVANQLTELNGRLQEKIDESEERAVALQKSKIALEKLNRKLVDQHQQLIQSEKMASVGQLAAGVAHEINNPTGFITANLTTLREYNDTMLSVISAYDVLIAECLACDKFSLQNHLQEGIESINKLKDNEDFKAIIVDLYEIIDDSLYGTSRIKSIVSDLKTFSRSHEKLTEDVDINESVINIALRLMANEIKYKCNVEIKLGEIPSYACYPGELSQVVINLLNNAYDAVHQNGTIYLDSWADEEMIYIQVADNGRGIELEHLTKLFDPFFTTKPVGSGTGLGLSISHEIVSKHGGRIMVESVPDKGSIFRIMLPLPLSKAA